MTLFVKVVDLNIGRKLLLEGEWILKEETAKIKIKMSV